MLVAEPRTIAIFKIRNGRRILLMTEYQVIIRNIGTVYDGCNKTDAIKTYNEYCKLSTDNYGRAGNEVVTLLTDGEIDREHFPVYRNLAKEWVRQNTIVHQNQCINTACKDANIEYLEEMYSGKEILHRAECCTCGATWAVVYTPETVIHINLNQD